MKMASTVVASSAHCQGFESLRCLWHGDRKWLKPHQWLGGWMGEKVILFPLLSDLQNRQLGQNLLSLSLSLSLSLNLSLTLSLLSLASQESHGSRMGSLTLNLFFLRSYFIPVRQASQTADFKILGSRKN
jgi:hypothetical protein